MPQPLTIPLSNGSLFVNLDAITGGMQIPEILFEVQRGGKFVVYQYCFSVLIMTFKRNTDVQFVKAGESAAAKSIVWTLLSLVVGWWGFPWGFIYTPQVIYKNLNGGTDITPLVMQYLQPGASFPVGV